MAANGRSGALTGAAGEGQLDRVESLDLEGRGIVRQDGKIAFVEGALPGERVIWERLRQGRSFDQGRVLRIVSASSARVVPRCAHFGLHRGACGGCSMQHLDARAQAAVKQRALEDALWHLGRVRPERILRPVHGTAWGYRHRARLSVRYVARKAGVLVGFHERASSFVAEMSECHILAGPVGHLLMPLREAIGSMQLRQRLPQIELAVVRFAGVLRTVLVFRILDPLPEADRQVLQRFGREHAVAVWTQTAGPATAAPLGPDDAIALKLDLPEFGVSLSFAPTDFTQVNHAINEILVRRAVDLLQIGSGDRVLDLYCGMGNFTLPLATRAAAVVGIEGHAGQIERARAAASANGLSDSVRFVVQDLSHWTRELWEELNRQEAGISRVLLDPPREGAIEVARALAQTAHRPGRLVYVSCNPATLARDCAVLVHEGGWRLLAAGIVNMFPHTSHVESIAVLAA
jgi:23S rRNA (uracil1939-C5)-methyltransferase